MKSKTLIASLAIAGGVLTSLAIVPSAQAYSVSFNGRTGGANMVDTRDITLDSRYDIGRTLDPTSWNFRIRSANNQLISGKGTLRVEALEAGKLTLSLFIQNLTDAAFQSSIISLGMGISPDATGISLDSPGAVFDNALMNRTGNFTGGFKNIDICLSGVSRCSGGNINQGLLSGMTDRFTFSVLGNFGVSGQNYSRVTLSDFASKWQTQAGSYTLAGVPEPMTIVGSGLALGLGGLMKRQAAKRQQKKQGKEATPV